MNSPAAVCTSHYSSTVTAKEEEEEEGSVWIKRKRQNSNPYNFTSGHESDNSSPPASPKTSAFMLSDKPRKPEEEAILARPAKRNRKLSLFSFNFTSKNSSEERVSRFWRGISQSSLFAQHESSNGSRFMKSGVPSTGDSTAQKHPQLSLNAGCSRIEVENKVLQEILQDTLKLQFDSVLEYKRDVCDRLAKNVSQLVKRRVEVFKESSAREYKVVSLVYVGAIKEEGIAVASQALLESDTDNFTVARYRNGHIFAVGAVMTIPIERNNSSVLSV